MNLSSVYKTIAPLILILLVAVAARFYKLGVVPHGMTWDEAAIGYNGYAIATVHRDEWLEFMPVSFRSFGDYKAPLAIYVNGVSTYLFGMNLWAVRLPFAVIGVLSVAGMYILTRLLFFGEKNTHLMALGAAAVLAVSPWHLHFSRTGFESGIALFFTIAMTICVLAAHKIKNLSKLQRFILLACASAAAAMSVYTYHSSKIVVPLLWCVLWLQSVFDGTRKRASLQHFFSASFFVVVLCIPLLRDSIYGHGLQRAGSLFFTSELGVVGHVQLFVRNIYAHLDPAFLIGGATDSLRHGGGAWGVLFPTTAVLAIIGFLQYCTSKHTRKELALIVAWVGIGFLPAVLGQTVPHANRALLALPALIVLAVYGLNSCVAKLQSTTAKHICIALFVLSHSLMVTAYLNHYYTHFAAQSTEAFADGYIEAYERVYEVVREYHGTPDQINKIIFSSEYGQPYIYALFTAETDAIAYQGGALARYIFQDVVGTGDLGQKNTLLVASQNTNLNFDAIQPLAVVYGSDGSERFYLVLSERVAQ